MALSIFKRLLLGVLVLIKDDQTQLEDEVDELEQEYSELETELEELFEEIHDEEEFSDDEEEETSELSKELRDYQNDKDESFAETNTERDQAFFEENNRRKDKSLLLDQLQESVDGDINQIDELQSQISDESSQWQKAYDLREKLVEHSSKTREVSRKWHENDLPPIKDDSSNDVPAIKPESSNDVPRFKQDSSDITQTDFDSSDYYDD